MGQIREDRQAELKEVLSTKIISTIHVTESMSLLLNHCNSDVISLTKKDVIGDVMFLRVKIVLCVCMYISNFIFLRDL